MSTGVDVNRQVTVAGREVNQSGEVALVSISAHAVITGSALKVYKFSASRARKVNLHPLRRIFPLRTSGNKVVSDGREDT